MNYSIKIIMTVLAMIALSWLSVETTFAYEKTARPSAKLTKATESPIDKREEILKKYLQKYNSPLTDSAGTFIKEADKNDLDWKLVVAISGVESYYGKHIPYNSNNGWGWGVYNGNVHNFASWDEGIIEISYELRTKYMNKWGASNVYEIGSFYAADPEWANKVTHFMEELESYSEGEDTSLLTLSI